MKKRLCIVFGLLSCISAFTQIAPEKEVNTVISEVTVFLDGAQISRKQNVNLIKGETILKFTNLSPFIDARSVQVKASGDITVLSVNHQHNFMDKPEKSDELKNLEAKLKLTENKIRLENAHLEILKEELTFLRENRVIGGKNQEVSVTNLKEATKFYSTQLSVLILKEIELNQKLVALQEEKQKLESQIGAMTSKRDYPSGEVLVKIRAERNTNAEFELSYLVSNAGWHPSYDIRAKSVNEPIELIYKANVRQDTKEDWNNVLLRFSSSEPNISGVAPELKTYFLNYNTLPPTYSKAVNRVSGIVVDSNQQPLPGATVQIEGTTIGTVTDINGNYSITIPSNASNLTFSFIGFETKTLPINNQIMNIALSENQFALEEIVVVGYGQSRSGLTSSVIQGRVSGVPANEKTLRARGTAEPIPTIQAKNQTSVDFEINIPFSVYSDNKSYSVDMAVYELPATYQYMAVPKIDKSAFLIARIIDWEKYSLLEGEANIFFEDTFVGKSVLDIRYASDTLQISLGRDKSISINREKTKDITTKRFVGNRKEEVRNWRTIIRNNKGQSIHLVIYDQVPVSTNSEIEVTVQKLVEGKHNPDNGEIKWEFTLEPSRNKELELQYSVRFPRNQNLIIE